MDPLAPQITIEIPPVECEASQKTPLKRKSEHDIASTLNKKIKIENEIMPFDKYFPCYKAGIPIDMIKNILLHVGCVYWIRMRSLNKTWKALFLNDVDLANGMHTAFHVLKQIDAQYKNKIFTWVFAANERPALLHYSDMLEWEGLEKTLKNILQRYDKISRMRVVNSLFIFLTNSNNYYHLKNDIRDLKDINLKEIIITKSNCVEQICRKNLHEALDVVLMARNELVKNVFTSKIAEKLLNKREMDIPFVKKLAQSLSDGHYFHIYESVDKLLTKVVQVELLEGKIEETKVTLNLFRIQEYKDLALACIVRKIGFMSIEEALNIAELIMLKKSRDKAIVEVIAIQASIDIAKAKNMIQRLHNQIYKDLAIVEIVKIEVKTSLVNTINTIEQVDNMSIKIALYRFAIGHKFELPSEAQRVIMQIE